MKQFSTSSTVETLIWKKPAFVLLRSVGLEFKPNPINLIAPATWSQEWRILPLFATWHRAELLEIYCLPKRNMTLYDILLLVSCFFGTAWLYIWMLLHFKKNVFSNGSSPFSFLILGFWEWTWSQPDTHQIFLLSDLTIQAKSLPPYVSGGLHNVQRKASREKSGTT